MSRPILPSFTLICTVLFASAPSFAADATAELHALFDREWERDLKDNPLLATYRGDTRYDDRWPDISPAAQAARNAADAGVLADLDRIPRDQLSPAEQLNHDLFRYEYEDRKAVAAFRPEYYDIRARDGPQSLNETAEVMPFQTVADYETWLRRMAAMPGYLDQYGELLRRAAREKHTQPRAIMERVLPQLAMQTPDDPETSPFFKQFSKYPGRRFPPPSASGSRPRRARSSRKSVIPAYRRFNAVFRDEYLPADPRDGRHLGHAGRPRLLCEPRALSHDDFADAGARSTRSGSPKSRAIAPRCRRSWTRSASRARSTEFFEHLRTDPQFYYKTRRRAVPRLCLHHEGDRPRAAAGFRQALPHALRPAPDSGHQRARTRRPRITRVRRSTARAPAITT